MLKYQNTILILSLLAIFVALIGLQPGPALAALPLGITETPTVPPPTDTPEPTQPPAPPGPTDTPLPPPPPTSEPTATPTEPGETEPPPRPPQQRRPTPTSTPFLPVTGELPPDTPFGGFGGYGLLLGGILLGLTVGLLSRRGGKWISRFFSSTR